ncbi:hypothetical protein BKA25_004892 [Actinoalloteichus hymeniacidonis]|nr:hypothetical protein [Actinoalloteichus hymeniacidonis]
MEVPFAASVLQSAWKTDLSMACVMGLPQRLP